MKTRARFSFRFTIERLRTLVLVGGLLLVTAIGIFLAAGQWRRHFLAKDLPKRLGIDIQQQADGVNYTQSRKGKTLFKIHAARAVQMKKDGKTLLHDVRIELYGEDGQSADTISGSEFEYDPGAGLAQAAGAVEITLKRPGEKPAIAQLKPQDLQAAIQPKASKALEKIPEITSRVAGPGNGGEIHVKTSGLSFDQHSGIATTANRVDFALQQGSGSSVGATFDSNQGRLILGHSVEMHVQRPGGAVTLQADHAEFERSQKVCSLTKATADLAGSKVQAGNALIHFTDEGSVTRMEGSGGVDLITQAGSHLASPRGTLDFDAKNHPRRGLLEGGARIDISQPGREMHGSAPTVQLSFDASGQLHQAHLERGVAFDSQQRSTTAKGVSTQLHRSWRSSTADISFASVHPVNQPSTGKNDTRKQGSEPSTAARTEIRTIHGVGSVILTSESVGDPAAGTSRLSANSVFAELASGGVFKSLSATGNAAFEQQTADGTHQTSNSDQLNVVFAAPGFAKPSSAPPGTATAPSRAPEIASIIQSGHVVFVQTAPPARSASQTGQSAPRPANPESRATADHAEYDGPTQVLHLSGAPRIQSGNLQLAAIGIDFSRVTGDAFAHGDVKASWSGSTALGMDNRQDNREPNLPGTSLLRASGGGSGGPVHAVAAEAELHRATGEIIFREAAHSSGNVQPRLWQGTNSITAPLITLNRQKQTLAATASSAAKPVVSVLVSNSAAKPSSNAHAATPSVIRLRSGELHYSEGERLAVFKSGLLSSVTAETTSAGGTATVTAQQAELRLMPAGVRPKPAIGGPNSSSTSEVGAEAVVDQMTARGHVTVDWPGRHGSGETLVYQSLDGTFTLTGTASALPRMTDQTRGSVTGSALIFHSRDDSVTVEGEGAKTVTETRSPK